MFFQSSSIILKVYKEGIMKRRIVSDSCSNIYKIDTVDYKTVPLKILVDDKEFIDDENLDTDIMMQEMENSETNSSSCPNVFEWKEAFAGADEIFAITITSQLSGSYNSCTVAANEYMEENPGSKVYVIDSLMTGAGMHIIIDKLCELFQQDLTFEEIRDQIQAYQKHTHLLFACESLQNLAKNGRIPMAVAKLAGLLSMRFVGKASDEGKFTQVGVARGEKKTLTSIVNEMFKMGYQGGTMYIGHALNLPAAEKLKNLVLEKLPNAKVQIEKLGGLNSYYAERGGMIIGFDDLAIK